MKLNTHTHRLWKQTQPAREEFNISPSVSEFFLEFKVLRHAQLLDAEFVDVDADVFPDARSRTDRDGHEWWKNDCFLISISIPKSGAIQDLSFKTNFTNVEPYRCLGFQESSKGGSKYRRRKNKEAIHKRH